jgi:hypothetical protein
MEFYKYKKNKVKEYLDSRSKHINWKDEFVLTFH